MPSHRQTEYQARLQARRRWREVRRSEEHFARQLRSVAAQVGHLVRGLAPTGVVTDRAALRESLELYGVSLVPWARAVAARMQADVLRRDEAAWRETAATLGKGLRRELSNAPTGEMVREYLNEQVGLITSLPLEAAKRVQDLTLEGITQAGRFPEIAREIMRTGEVTASRANLIARTEVARTASLVVESRALHLGSPGYLWRTVGDSDVRPATWLRNFAALNTEARGSHRRLEGTFHRWNEPPISGSRGERAHAGQIYNCRCWPEPVLDEARLRDLMDRGEIAA